jgi:hypothetical protein
MRDLAGFAESVHRAKRGERLHLVAYPAMLEGAMACAMMQLPQCTVNATAVICARSEVAQSGRGSARPAGDSLRRCQ